MGPQRDSQHGGTTGLWDGHPGCPRSLPQCRTLPVTGTCVFAGKVWVPKQKPIDPVLESVTLEPELEEALANASDAELCDIAGKSHSRSPCMSSRRSRPPATGSLGWFMSA